MPCMTRHEVAKAGDLIPGKFKIVQAAGVEIGLFQLNTGEWRAYRNFCPHMGAPVCTGPLSKGTRQALRCPWHAWDFDLTTGELEGDADVHLDSYKIEVEDGSVFVWA